MLYSRSIQVFKITIALLLLFTVVVSSSIQIAFAQTSDDTIINPELIRSFEVSGCDSLPVMIWIEDIDHTIVMREVESELGYDLEDIELNIQPISNSIAEKLASKDDVSEYMREYLKNTDELRQKQKILTDNYIKCERQVSAAYYTEHNRVISDRISDNKLLFVSKYSPLVIAELSLDEIEDLSQNDSIQSIDYCEPVEITLCTDELVQLRESTRIEEIHEDIGLTGAGVKVGIVESTSITTNNELPASRFSVVGIPYSLNNSHVINTSRIFAGNYGVANGATVYSAAIERGMYNNYSGYPNICGAIELLLEQNVSVINCSFLISANSSYTTLSKWIDHIAAEHYASFVVSSGNNGKTNNYDPDPEHDGSIADPALAYNAITVGAYNNMNTRDPSDDVMYYYSSNDSGTGCSKPDLVAPANMLGGGTSSSAPFVSGVIALMLELRPSLAAYPQVVKAILSASCHHKAAAAGAQSTETMAQGLTFTQGAGVIDPYMAISITGQGNYGVRNVTTNINIRVKQFAYGASGLNVSISWLKSNSVSGSHYQTGVTEGPTHNFALNLKYTTSTVLKSSDNSNSSVEMVYYSTPASYSDYIVNITKSTSTSAKVGYAWSVNTNRYQYTLENEGFYRLKNRSSGYYLKRDTSGLLIQSSYSNVASQQWLILSDSSNYRILNNTAANNAVILSGTEISGTYTAKTGLNTSYPIHIVNNTDGSISMYQLVSGKRYYLSIMDTTNNSELKWKYCQQITNAQKWYPEKIVYLRGDVDQDGQILADDAQQILRYSAHLQTFSDVQVFLADLDGNGVIDAADSRIALRISAGLR